MKLTFLGTGTSTGVPEIGCGCDVCTSRDPRDNRLRASLLVETGGITFIIDCGPDFRYQMLRQHIRHIDAILLTHEHYDHVSGLDDVRKFSYTNGMDVYAEENVLDAIRTRIPYVFRENKYPGVPELNLHPITTAPFKINGTEIIPVRLMHHRLPILGFRIGNMAYLTDLKTIPGEEYNKLKDLDVLIINALKFGIHLSHQGVDEALQQIKKIAPREAWLTHMSHTVGLHSEIEKDLLPHIHFAYDGLVINMTNKKEQLFFANI
ncbi:MAG: MBL fold metallo-hydrolase [Tannerellaceae bacterium]|nr:MBL fold metallo-hydrolase [Tannerellaceae bacterium]